MRTRVAGIEPALAVLKTAALPLNYTPIMGAARFELAYGNQTVLQTAAFDRSAIHPMQSLGFEPRTNELKVRCSTFELRLRVPGQNRTTYLRFCKPPLYR